MHSPAWQRLLPAALMGELSATDKVSKQFCGHLAGFNPPLDTGMIGYEQPANSWEFRSGSASKRAGKSDIVEQDEVSASQSARATGQDITGNIAGRLPRNKVRPCGGFVSRDLLRDRRTTSGAQERSARDI